MRPFKLLLLLLLVSLPVGCSREPAPQEAVEDESTGDALSHDMMVLGRQLEDPYSLKNVTKALANLYPSKAEDLRPTDMYVRFLPADEDQFALLESLGVNMLDHPLDYQILREGDYYHDPKVPEGAITWQYAVLPHDFELPQGIVYEILDDCYIPENAATKASDVDWDAVEREAFRLSGNADMLLPVTKAKTNPSGRITIEDPLFNGGQPFGVAGVRVVCNVFVKFASTFTTRDGYYTIPKTFSSSPRYRLMFQNQKGFEIGFNLLLVPASLSTLGKGPAAGIDAHISEASDRKLFCRSVVNNAAWEYYERCAEDDLKIATPPPLVRIWIFQKIADSSSPMLRHGTLLDMTLLNKFLGDYTPLLALFLPDITIGAENKYTYSSLYAETVHELSHASHFSQVGKEYWDKYILYVLDSFINDGAGAYGTGTGDDAGYCGIGESWAYFMQNTLMNDRYGGTMPTSGSSYWFHPQIFRYLYERSFTRSQLFAALGEEVHSEEALKDRLLKLYPDKSGVIQQVFARYVD